MPLPSVTHDQRRLFCLNWNELPVLKGALGPGVDVQPLFLDAENGIWSLRAIFAPGITLPNHFHTGTVPTLDLAAGSLGEGMAKAPPSAPPATPSKAAEPATPRIVGTSPRANAA